MTFLSSINHTHSSTNNLEHNLIVILNGCASTTPPLVEFLFLPPALFQAYWRTCEYSSSIFYITTCSPCTDSLLSNEHSLTTYFLLNIPRIFELTITSSRSAFSFFIYHCIERICVPLTLPTSFGRSRFHSNHQGSLTSTPDHGRETEG